MTALRTAQAQQIERLVAAFLLENSAINLSAIRDEAGVREKHVADSLAARALLHSLQLEEGRKALDIGSGSGFPLLPLAIAFAGCKWHGLDSVGKKLAAIERMAGECGISDLVLHHARAEEAGHLPELREQFALVTARAVAPWPVLVELATPFVSVGGYFLAYRGPENDTDDIPLAAKLNLKFVQKQAYTLATGEQRTLWLFCKTALLPKRFPRAVGIPKKQPLALADF